MTHSETQLAYEPDVVTFQGAGIAQLGEYVFSLEDQVVKGRYLESRESAAEVEAENIFASSQGTIAVTIEAGGDWATFQRVVVVETSSAGLYQARLHLHYDIAGRLKKKSTPWVYIFMEEPNHASGS